MWDKSYFQLLETPVSGKDAAAQLYCMPDSDTVGLFNSVNGIGPDEMLYPGRLILTPSLDGASQHGAAAMRSLAEQANHSQRNGTAAADPRSFNRNFDLFATLSGSARDASIAGDYFGGISDYLAVRLKLITRDFNELEKVYNYGLSHGMKLNSPQFQALRRPVEEALRQQLKGWHRSAIVRNANRPSLKDAVGISHKSLAHSFRTTGNPVEIKQIKQAIDRAGKLSKRLERIGTFGRVLSMGATVPAIVSDFKSKGTAAGAHTLGHSAAGLAGGFVGGDIGVAAGMSTATAALLIFGAGTGGIGFIVIGIGAVAGGFLGSALGSSAGEAGYGRLEVLTNKAAESAIEYFITEDRL